MTYFLSIIFVPPQGASSMSTHHCNYCTSANSTTAQRAYNFTVAIERLSRGSQPGACTGLCGRH
eukprot:6196441-Pleurochrysis_carterae.AAC.1